MSDNNHVNEEDENDYYNEKIHKIFEIGKIVHNAKKDKLI